MIARMSPKGGMIQGRMTAYFCEMHLNSSSMQIEIPKQSVLATDDDVLWIASTSSQVDVLKL